LSCNLRPFFGAERFYPPNKIVSAGLDSLGIAVADLAKPEVAADIDAFRHGRTGRATDPQPRRYGPSRMSPERRGPPFLVAGTGRDLAERRAQGDAP